MEKMGVSKVYCKKFYTSHYKCLKGERRVSKQGSQPISSFVNATQRTAANAVGGNPITTCLDILPM